MSAIKDAFISQLLASDKPGGGKTGPLVQELGVSSDGLSEGTSPGTESVVPPAPPADDGPSMLELMMAAHKEAKVEKEIKTTEEQNKTTKTFGTGFKKGFFGGSSGTAKTTATSKPTSKSNNASVSATASAVPTNNDIPTIVKPNKNSLQNKNGGIDKDSVTATIAEEVKRAMSEDESPVLKQLKQGDWVTPDLIQIFAGNPIISRGLQNPKCQAAMQLMQKDPKTAQQRYQGDPEVDAFLREFGNIMSTHFDKLGEQQQQPPQQTTSTAKGTNSTPSITPITTATTATKSKTSQPSLTTGNRAGSDSTGTRAGSETMGPLQAQALARHHANAGSSPASSGSSTSIVHGSSSQEKQEEERDAERVKEIVSDPELSALLLDVQMQHILQECGDPRKFQEHMRNPATASKIKKLFDAGLVGTVK